MDSTDLYRIDSHNMVYDWRQTFHTTQMLVHSKTTLIFCVYGNVFWFIFQNASPLQLHKKNFGTQDDYCTRTRCYHGKQLVPISRFDTSYKRVMIVCNIISSTFFPSGRSILVFFPASSTTNSLLGPCQSVIRLFLFLLSNFTNLYHIHN